MERHQETQFGARLPAALSRVLRCAGWCALLVALWLAVAGKGWALGSSGMAVTRAWQRASYMES
ncbi:DUF3325 domain-containing protein [Paraburkholderia sp. CNPSo 3076]|nr:DUF3325 domain-containing protein [Paraburkholderia sp. CNPSo 3076]